MISVVIPAFNPGPLLKDALASVVAQTYQDWDLVVVDDGSTEDLSWVRDVDPRIRLIRTDHLGASIARNVGIGSTDGKYVAFLDADDRWRPGKLALQLNALSRGALFSYTAFDLIDEAGNRIGPGYGAEVGYLDMLAGTLGVVQSSATVRRDALEAVGMFNPLLWVQQDLDLFIKLAHLGPSVYTDSVEVEYRIHGSNLTKAYWRAVRELLLVYDLHEVAARTTNDDAAIAAIAIGRRAVRRTYSYQAIDAARVARRGGRNRDAALDLCRSLQLSPYAVAKSAKSFLDARLRAADR
jgi:glycosyltransferase involved in cell wall biosynthesis